jgi:hypothetical protein
MIHQCYFDDWQLGRMFATPVYQPFRLTPERTDLCEFEAMLAIWRYGQACGHDWVGFTSWRQLDKSTRQFESLQQIAELLGDRDGIGWHYVDFGTSLANQAEDYHHGIMDFLSKITRLRTGVDLTDALRKTNAGFFASYWVLRWPRFVEFAEWLASYCELASGMPDDSYLRSDPKAFAYAAERLFIIWYAVQGLQIGNVS